MTDPPCCGDIPLDAIRISTTHRWGERARLEQLPRDPADVCQVLLDEEPDWRGWRVWWSDERLGPEVRVYDSRTDPWNSVPGRGIQVVAVYFQRDYAPGKPYRRLIHSCDYYEGWGRRLTGTLVTDDLFDRIMAEAEEAVAW